MADLRARPRQPELRSKMLRSLEHVFGRKAYQLLSIQSLRYHPDSDSEVVTTRLFEKRYKLVGQLSCCLSTFVPQIWTPVCTDGSDGTQLVQLVHYDGTLQHGEILALEGCRNIV